MALTNSGFDGTVTEAAWANMSALTDVDAVESSAAWALTQGTGRQVSTAAHSGYAFAKGVLSKDTAAILTSLSTPTNGQWFLIVRHIVWSTNTVTVAAVAHSTTTTTVPTAPPSTYPMIDNDPGVLYDQKLGWAWVRSTDTTVTLFDLRTLSAETRITALEAGWVAFTPSFTSVTVGNGTLSGRLLISSGTATVLGQLTFGSTTTLPANEWYLAFPTAAPPSSAIQVRGVVGVFGLWDNSTPDSRVVPALKNSDTHIKVPGVSVRNDIPWNWTVNDVLSFNLSYPV